MNQYCVPFMNCESLVLQMILISIFQNYINFVGTSSKKDNQKYQYCQHIDDIEFRMLQDFHQELKTLQNINQHDQIHKFQLLKNKQPPFHYLQVSQMKNQTIRQFVYHIFLLLSEYYILNMKISNNYY
ncbi:hypothetical protein pb186bvf_019882 [Paramecium bursaria]